MKKIFLVLFLFTSVKAIAQLPDSAIIKDHKIYFGGGLELGGGFGNINIKHKLPEYSKGAYGGLNASMMVNHFLVEGKAGFYTDFKIFGASSQVDIYSLSAGGQLPLSAKHAILLSAGVSLNRFSYPDQPTPASANAYSFGSSYDYSVRYATGVPFQVKYLFIVTSFFGVNAAGSLNVNSVQTVGTVTAGLVFGNLSEGIKPKHHRPFFPRPLSPFPFVKKP